jgi:hypothetical protein
VAKVIDSKATSLQANVINDMNMLEGNLSSEQISDGEQRLLLEMSFQALYSKEEFAKIIKSKVELPKLNVTCGTTTSE